MAPAPEIRQEIESTFAKVKAFATKVHAGEIKGAGGEFKNVLVIGIGGSALGPQFVAQALGNPRKDKLKPYFFDNTDPDGMNRTLSTIGRKLDRTLCIVISKSGGTKETRNGMLVAQAAYEKAGLKFGQHAVAVTMFGSELDQYTDRQSMARTVPDVGLGRRPHERALGSGIIARRPARYQYRRSDCRRSESGYIDSFKER